MTYLYIKIKNLSCTTSASVQIKICLKSCFVLCIMNDVHCSTVRDNHLKNSIHCILGLVRCVHPIGHARPEFQNMFSGVCVFAYIGK